MSGRRKMRAEIKRPLTVVHDGAPIEIDTIEYITLTCNGAQYRIQPCEGGLAITLDRPFGKALACVGRASNALRLRAVKP